MIDFSRAGSYKLLGVGVILLFMLGKASHIAAEFSGGYGGDTSGATSGLGAMAGVAAFAVAMDFSRRNRTPARPDGRRSAEQES